MTDKIIIIRPGDQPPSRHAFDRATLVIEVDGFSAKVLKNRNGGR